MNIFVAAWYYPPVTSSEAIVTYKLLRNSKHNYDVFSSLSNNWSYHTNFGQYDESNINTYTISTDSIDEWADACVDKFEELNRDRKYDCIMTRSTPPESITVGKRIKEKHPEIKWIASLADPVANNPYEVKRYVKDNPLLNKREKKQLAEALQSENIEALAKWKKRPENGIKRLCYMKELEDDVLKSADLIVAPTERQLKFLDGDRGWKSKYFTVPHSFDPALYPEKREEKSDKTVFVYTGYSDEIRSLKPLVEAVELLKQSGSSLLDRCIFRIIGNTPAEIKDEVFNYDLQDIIHIESSVDYYESLRIMSEADWLIHVDAYFEGLEPDGSIFFAGKIADYLGAGKPILALTGENTPAARIIRKAGGVVVGSKETALLADTIESICAGSLQVEPNSIYIEQYKASNVADSLDKKINELCLADYSERKEWIDVQPAKDEKILTICVPSYNVQRCLDRCLLSLVSCKYAPYFEIIVVDDGSKDCTLQIAKAYEEHYPGIVKAIHKDNGGHGSTINVAMEAASGKYFRVVDSDDWIDSAALDRIIERMLSGEIDTDVVCANYNVVNLEKGTSIKIKQDCLVTYDVPMALEDVETDKIYFTMSGCMFRLPALRKSGKQLQEHTFYVDVEFILFPIPYINTVTFVDEYVYKYSQGNTEQSVYIPNMVKRYDHHERVLKRVIDYRVSTEMSAAQAEYFDSVLKRLLYTHYGLCLVYDENKAQGYSRIAEFDAYLNDTYPDMARWIGTSYPVVRAARRVGFNYKLVRYSPENMIQAAKRRAISMVKAEANKKIVKKLVMNILSFRLMNLV